MTKKFTIIIEVEAEPPDESVGIFGWSAEAAAVTVKDENGEFVSSWKVEGGRDSVDACSRLENSENFYNLSLIISEAVKRKIEADEEGIIIAPEPEDEKVEHLEEPPTDPPKEKTVKELVDESLERKGYHIVREKPFVLFCKKCGVSFPTDRPALGFLSKSIKQHEKNNPARHRHGKDIES